MVQYYTLEEAARLLHTTPEKLKEMAKRNELRAFQDRGTLRFRAPEIDEMVRAQGLGSDGELPRREAGAPRPKTRATPAPPPPADDDLELSLDFDLGPSEGKSGPRSAGGTPKSGKTGTKSSGPKSGPKGGAPASGPRSPAPTASDSDVRLVMDGGALDFQIDLDSDVKVPPSGPKSGGPKTPGRRSKAVPPDAADSGVRIVPLDQPSDSDVKVVPSSDDSDVPLGVVKPKTPSDSDIRLEDLPGGQQKRSDSMVTEEIDLDAEALKLAEEAARAKPKSKSKTPRSKYKPAAPSLPTSSPFELSEHDLSLDEPKKPSKPSSKGSLGGSSDFDLTPEGQSPLELGSGEIPLLADDDEVSLGELGGGGAGHSGINLGQPLDSGISLEDGGSDEMELDFELSLDGDAPASSKGPASGRASGLGKPAGGGVPDIDSSSEFELTLDDDLESGGAVDNSDSEFELTLDGAEEGSDEELSLEPSAKASTVPQEDSDSEFELTLDQEDAAAEEGSSEFELTLEGAEAESDEGSSEFELTLEGNEGAGDEGSSEFELTLDQTDGVADEGSSEFELSLDEADGGGGEGAETSSDSEFELTLDPSEEGDAELELDGEDKDIFEETNFDVPALDDESASEAMALDESDTDMESDFDGGEEAEGGAESGSQVVSLDDDEADDAAETVARPRKKAKVKTKMAPAGAESEPGLEFGMGEGGEAPLDEEADLDEEEDLAPVAAGKAAPPAEWGPLPAILLFPTVIVLFVAGLMGFELVQGMWGYNRPNKISRPVIETIAGIFDDKLANVNKD